jgi:methyl-accepting chemotaxis protein
MTTVRKTTSNQNLNAYRVWIEDNEPNSKYFRVSNVPEVLTGGKNSFLIVGNRNLIETSQVLIEILDSDGNAVFLQPIPRYTEGLARVVSIEIYENTPPGPATITILGHLGVDEFGNTPPEEFKNSYNVKWQKRILIEPTKKNEENVRFFNAPIITASEILVPVTETLPIDNGVYSTAVKTYNLAGNTIVKNYTGKLFNNRMVGGTLFTTVGGVPFSASILEIYSNTEARLDTFFTGSLSGLYETGSIIYDGVSSVTQTTATKSFAEITLTNLQTFSGDVDRVKLYVKSIEQAGDYDFISDNSLEETEISVTQSLSTGNPYVSIGTLTNSNWNTYFSYDALTSTGLYSSSSLDSLVVAFQDDNVLLSSIVAYYDDPNTPGMYFGFKPYFSASAGHAYNVSWQLVGTKYYQEIDGSIEVYLIGTAITPNTSLGLKIGEAHRNGSDNAVRFDPETVTIVADRDGTISLRFVVRDGVWYASGMKISSTIETGFNPDFAKFIVPVINHRFERLKFKAELYDGAHRLIPITVETSPVLFNGGNLIIKGGDNRISGRLIVSPSGSGPIIVSNHSGSFIGIGGLLTDPYPIPPEKLPFYTGSAIVTIFSGSNPYSGSITPTSSIGIQIVDGTQTGSYFHFDPKTGVQIKGDIRLLPNTPLSSSIINISQSLYNLSSSLTVSASASTNAANIALSQIQQLVSGTFTGGTFINGNMVVSPIIAGALGYISQSFGVGNIAGNKGIILTAQGYTSASINVTNAPAIYIGGGAYASSSTPFFVASGSTGTLFSLGTGLRWNGTSLFVTGDITLTVGSSLSGSIDGNAKTTTQISGNVVQMTGSLGSVSGSLINVSGGLTNLSASVMSISASNQAATNAANIALANIQSVVSGTYAGGTFISSNMIISPIIAGRFGYISQSFGIGDISANNGIVLTAQGYTSASINVTSAPAIYIGAGAYASSSTPFFVTSGSRGTLMSLGNKFIWDGNSLFIIGDITLAIGSSLSGSIDGNAKTTTQISGNVVQMTGSLGNISGSLINVSGNVVQMTGSLGSVSGSLINVSGALVNLSASDQAATNAANIALANIQSVVSGTYSGGTFISSTKIISPIIAGNLGYISQSFGVGDITGNKGIILTAQGYTSASINVTNAPAIYIGAGAYASSSTPFFVASGSGATLFSLGNKFVWNGSSLFITGDITLTAGSSLSSSIDGNAKTTTQISGNVVQITGSLGNISGSLINVSGNVVQMTGSLGGVSGSLINVSGAIVALSASNQAATNSANIALANIQSIVSGTYTGGTFISNTKIISPIIAGTLGYISQSFGVGDITGNKGIILTAQGYTSASINVTNAPAIYIGAGAYASSSTPFFVASGSGATLFSLGNKLVWDGNSLFVIGDITLAAGTTLSSSIDNNAKTTTQVSGNVVQITGSLGNISGSLINVSGNVVQITGSLVNVSGSLINVSGALVNLSASNQTATNSANTALANIQSLVSGTYSGGTFISNTKIISPIIAGNLGYISQSFGVGDITGNKGIILTAQGYTSASINVTNAPSIYIGAGAYASSSTPFFVASGSGATLFSLGNKFVWDGSSLFITGDITLTAGSTLSSSIDNNAKTTTQVSGNVVQITGSLGNVSGSLINVSGNVVQITGSLGNVSGSLINVSGALVNLSASNQTVINSANTALANIQSLVSGTYSGGTFISNKIIISPVIAGNLGYISQSFGVGDITNNKAIILTAQGYTSASVLVTNAPAIYIGSGSYANTNTPFFVASGSTATLFSLGNKFVWNGTSLFITGDITLTAGSSLSSSIDTNSKTTTQVSGNVVSITGSLGNVSGSLINVSGNLVAMTGSLVNVSGSLINVSGALVNLSASNQTVINSANTALANIQSLVSGTYSGGTFISNKMIVSPILAGTIGYISQSFGVGDIAGGNGIVLTAVGYTSASINFPSASIYIGAGNYANSDTPFFVAKKWGSALFSLGSQLIFDGTQMDVGATATLNGQQTRGVVNSVNDFQTGSFGIDIGSDVTKGSFYFPFDYTLNDSRNAISSSVSSDIYIGAKWGKALSVYRSGSNLQTDYSNGYIESWVSGGTWPPVVTTVNAQQPFGSSIKRIQFSPNVSGGINNGHARTANFVSLTSGSTYSFTTWVRISAELESALQMSIGGGVGMGTLAKTSRSYGEWSEWALEGITSTTTTTDGLYVSLTSKPPYSASVDIGSLQFELNPYRTSIMSGSRINQKTNYNGIDVTRLTEFTIMGWTYVTDTGSSFNMIAGAWPTFYTSYFSTNQLIISGLSGTSGVQTSVVSSLPSTKINVYNHVAISYSLKTKIAKLYFNGQLLSSGSWTMDPTQGGSFGWGSISGTDASYPLNGLLDDAAILKRVLSDVEIRAVYNANGPLYDSYELYEARRRIETIRDSSGNIKSGVGQSDGNNSFALAKFGISGLAAHGDTVSFSPAWQNTPTIIFGPGGLTFDPALTGSAIYQDIAASSVTPTGFSIRALLRQLGGGGTSLSSSIVRPTADGYFTKNSAISYNDTYTYNYNVTVYGNDPGYSGGVTVGFWTNLSGVSSLRGTRTFTNTHTADVQYSSQSLNITVAGLSSGSKFWTTVESITGNGGVENTNQVTYQSYTSTAPLSSSATPSSSVFIPYYVIGVAT